MRLAGRSKGAKLEAKSCRALNSTVFSFTLLAFSLLASAQTDVLPGTARTFLSKLDSEAPDVFEKQVFHHVRNAEFLQAIKASAEYAQNLLSRYPQSTFEKAFFRSAAEHMSFHSAFDNWSRVGEEQLGLPETLASVGFNVLLALEGSAGEGKFFLCSVDFGQIERQMSLEPSGKTGFTDQEMMLMSKMLAMQFGVIRTKEFKKVGSHRVIVLSIDTPVTDPSVCLVNLACKQRLYMLVLISSVGNYSENEKQLFDTIKSISFDYKSADETKIKSVRERFSDRNDVESVLECVRSLAELGEYNAAAEELARLQLLLIRQMPKPHISGNQANDPVYGISVTNPDDKKWKLSVMQEGGLRGILITDRFSVKEEGVLIQVIDSVLAYGPRGAKAMAQMMDRKEFLTGVGRGAAMFTGRIERERFTPFKGGLAYDATIKVNSPGLKARILCTERKDFILMILMLLDSNEFQDKVKEYEKIVESCLRIESSEPFRK